MGKLYSLMGILAVTRDECLDAFASAISDYEDAVIERTAVKALPRLFFNSVAVTDIRPLLSLYHY